MMRGGCYGKPLLSYGLSRNVIIAHGRPAQCVQTRRETMAGTSKWHSCGQEDKYTTNLITVSWLAVCTAHWVLVGAVGLVHGIGL